MSDEIIVTKEMLKAIGADTRIAILKALVDRQKTQSELAEELKLAGPTVLEHLDHLVSAGLIEKLEEGRKWKYYKLTKTGQKIIGKSPVYVVMLLSVSLLIAFAALFLIAQKTIFFVPQVMSPALSLESKAMETKTLQTDQEANKQEVSQEKSTESTKDEAAPSAEVAAGDQFFMNSAPPLPQSTIEKKLADTRINTPNENISNNKTENLTVVRGVATTRDTFLQSTPHTLATKQEHSLIPESIVFVIFSMIALVCGWKLIQSKNG